jgi:hypothetical protein
LNFPRFLLYTGLRPELFGSAEFLQHQIRAIIKRKWS